MDELGHQSGLLYLAVFLGDGSPSHHFDFDHVNRPLFRLATITRSVDRSQCAALTCFATEIVRTAIYPVRFRLQRDVWPKKNHAS